MRSALLLGLQARHCFSQDGKVTFHCDIDLRNANSAWSREKREWCCEKEGVACEEDFHCEVALRNHALAWSSAKKKFCCKTAGIACEGLESIFVLTTQPQVDPGNLLAQAPVKDWPAAEGEGKLAEAPDEELFMPCDDMARRGLFIGRVRREEGEACWAICGEENWRMWLAPWLALTLLVALLLTAYCQARCAKRDSEVQDTWANGIILGSQVSQALLVAAAVLWVLLAGPVLLIFDAGRPSVCFKAILAATFSLPQLPTLPDNIQRWLWWLEDYKSCVLGFLAALFSWWTQEVKGRCCRGDFPPKDYAEHRPLSGKLDLTDAEQRQASNEVHWIRFLMQQSSFFGTWFSVDSLCQGRPFLTLAAACGSLATARWSSGLYVNLVDLNGRQRRLQCTWASDTVTLFKLSWEPGLGFPCNELYAKCGFQAATECSILVYITVFAMVAGDVITWADLVLPLWTALLALRAVRTGIGRCFEIASAELARRATHKGLQGIGAATAPSHANDQCPTCQNRYMADSKYCRRCGTKRSSQEQVLSQDAAYCASLIQFQDFSARQTMASTRLKAVSVAFRLCEVLPVAVGLALWCESGQLSSGYLVGLLPAVTWELIHPPVRQTHGFRLWACAERTFECLLWPIYSTFVPLHLADPTRDHNEEEAVLDHLMLPAWCGLRTLYILILWVWACFNSESFPELPEFLSWNELKDPRQWQLLLAWCWVVAGALAALLFPILAVRVHSNRERWAEKDWKAFVRHQVDAWQTVQEVSTTPAMYNLRDYEDEAVEGDPIDDDDVLGLVHGFCSGQAMEKHHLLALDPQKKKHLKQPTQERLLSVGKGKASSSVKPSEASSAKPKHLQQVLDLRLPQLFEAKQDVAVQLRVDMDFIESEYTSKADVSLEDGFKYGYVEVEGGGLALHVWKDQQLEPKVKLLALRGKHQFSVAAASAASDFAALHQSNAGHYTLMQESRGVKHPLIHFEVDPAAFRRERRIVAYAFVTDPSTQKRHIKQDLQLAEAGKDFISGAWKFRAMPAVDAVLMFSCMLTIAVYHY
ncbi:unnamed protein product [Effrenium voratum]|nr:unnamed protein product [Effrenium voratum]